VLHGEIVALNAGENVGDVPRPDDHGAVVPFRIGQVLGKPRLSGRR